MAGLKEYERRAGTEVTAVRLDLETDGFTYRKWGGVQTCSRGDWLVNGGEGTHTVEEETFARTYRMVSPGVYEKVGHVWARMAEVDGKIRTKEGFTEYRPGDFIVYNDPDEKDGYAMRPETFARLYEPAN